MHRVHSADYHLLRGYYLQHTLGEYDTKKAKSRKIGEQEKTLWRKLTGVVPQDAFAKLLEFFGKIQDKIFPN